MAFGHDMVHALADVVELVNTSPSTGGDDDLASLAELQSFVESRQISGIGTLTARDLGQVRMVREAFHRVFTAPDQATAVRVLNSLLSETRITPRLTEHDGHPLHIHYFAPTPRSPSTWRPTAGWRWRSCWSRASGSGCAPARPPTASSVFVDESRNRSRVYCDSRTCGNRMHVAAYRARRRA